MKSIIDIISIIIFIIIIPLTFIGSLYVWGEFGGLAVFLFLILMVVIIFLTLGISQYLKDKIIVNKLNSNDVPEEEKEKIREQVRHDDMTYLKRKNVIKQLSRVKYEGGHEKFSEVTNGDIDLYEKEIEFYSEFSNEILFSIPLSKIKNIKYDSSENLSLGKFIMFGVASLAFKDKTHYLIIEYIGDSGMTNQVVFETGGIKNQSFLNELNVLRNKLHTKINTTTKSIDNGNSVQIIKQLADLKAQGILTEEEFAKKKEELLNKI